MLLLLQLLLHWALDAVTGAVRCAAALAAFYAALAAYVLRRAPVDAPCLPLLGTLLREREAAGRVHLYSLAATLLRWREPHYRAASWGADVAANLANLAVPGTGEVWLLARWAAWAAG